MKIAIARAICFILLQTVFVNPANGSEHDKTTLTFGEVFPKVEETKRLTLPIVQYVVDKLNQTDIVTADAVITDNMEEMVRLIKKKKVDVFVDTLHPLVYMKNQGIDLKPILYRLKKNVKLASGVFIAKSDNDSIQSIDDLVGKKLLFKTIHATQAHLVPRAFLIKNGFLLNYSKALLPDAINCSFASDYHDIEDMIISGAVDAGTTSSHRLELLVPEQRQKIKIIGQTAMYPYHLVSIASHLSPKLADKIEKILVGMGDDPDARRILARYYRTSGFEVLTKDALHLIEDLAGYCDSRLHRVGGDAVTVQRKRSIVIGRASKSPNKHYKRLKPIVDYVASQLKELGITRGEVVFAKDNAEMIRYIKQGKVDWVTESLFSGLMFCEKTGAQILVRRWKSGVAEYHSVIFTRKDSKIETLQGLKGRKIAFEDPGSTTGFIVPLNEFHKIDMDLVELQGPRSEPLADKVGYVFSGGEINTTTLVHKGIVDAGVYSNLDWEDPSECPPIFKKDLHIIHRTRNFPRTLEIVRKDLDPKIKERLKAILLNAADDRNAQVALKAYGNTSGFDEFDSETALLVLDVHRSTKDQN